MRRSFVRKINDRRKQIKEIFGMGWDGTVGLTYFSKFPHSNRVQNRVQWLFGTRLQFRCTFRLIAVTQPPPPKPVHIRTYIRTRISRNTSRTTPNGTTTIRTTQVQILPLSNPPRTPPDTPGQHKFAREPNRSERAGGFIKRMRLTDRAPPPPTPPPLYVEKDSD